MVESWPEALSLIQNLGTQVERVVAERRRFVVDDDDEYSDNGCEDEDCREDSAQQSEDSCNDADGSKASQQSEDGSENSDGSEDSAQQSENSCYEADGREASQQCEDASEKSDGNRDGKQRKRVRDGGETVTEFFVKWRNLSYSQARALPYIKLVNVSRLTAPS